MRKLKFGLCAIYLIGSCLFTQRVHFGIDCTNHDESSQKASDRTIEKQIEDLVDDLPNLASFPLKSNRAKPGGFIATTPKNISNNQPSEAINSHAVETVREIVSFGADAIPVLVAHLSDSRETKIRIGENGPVFAMWFDNEYDPKIRIKTEEQFDLDSHAGLDRTLRGGYTVKVGDICFALVGQIVNRHLLAVRYQHSGCLIVNSPVESPELAERVKQDWYSTSKCEHKASLINDLRTATVDRDGMSALVRLEYYYPESLSRVQEKELLKKISRLKQMHRQADTPNERRDKHKGR